MTPSLNVVGMGRPESGLFDEAVNALLSLPWRPELAVEEIPAPQRIAPYAVAIAADVEVGDDELGNGRLVLLHDPDGNPAWDGTFRCVLVGQRRLNDGVTPERLTFDVGGARFTVSVPEMALIEKNAGA